MCVEHFWVLIPDIVLVLVSEFMVDWVKHAFITKFNEIPSEVSTERKYLRVSLIGTCSIFV